jgi:thiamine-monophosphate kinase
MTENQIIAWIQRHAPNFGSGVQVSIGDDCAVYRPSAKEDLVFTTDFTIEGRHFRFPDSPPREAGHKALARGLSDIAAMGATPRFALISLAASNLAVIKPFLQGVFALAKRFEVTIAGGDLSFSQALYCDVTVAGVVPKGKAILRSTARPGDTLYVSGPLGIWKKKPVPRLDLVPVLRRHATAAMDLTDGLSTDLDRLLRASEVTAEITAAPPVHRGATLHQAWHEGEDYELLVASKHKLPAPFHAIGKVLAGRPGSPLPPKGWLHFR